MNSAYHAIPPASADVQVHGDDMVIPGLGFRPLGVCVLGPKLPVPVGPSR
jgi:hypothetical protein